MISQYYAILLESQYISQWYSLEYPTMYIYIDPYIVINRISTINHPFWGFPMYGNLHI